MSVTNKIVVGIARSLLYRLSRILWRLNKFSSTKKRLGSCDQPWIQSSNPSGGGYSCEGVGDARREI